MFESRVAPLSGVAFVALLIGAIALIRNFSFIPPAEDAVAFFEERSGAIVAGAYLAALAGFFLLWFGGSLNERLRRSKDGSDTRLASLALAGAVFSAITVSAGVVVLVAGAERFSIGGEIGPDGATTIFDLAGILSGNLAPYGFAAMMAATALHARGSGLLPRWAIRITSIGAVGLLTPVNWMLLWAPLLWIPAMGVFLFRQPDTGDTRAGNIEVEVSA